MRTLSCFSILFWFNLAHALTYNGYTLNPSTNIVTDGELEWLQWDVTVEMSVNDALSTFGSQGWRLASAEEGTALLNHFFPSFFPFINPQDLASDIQNQEFVLQGAEYSFSQANQFIDLFGDTAAAAGNVTNHGDPWESSSSIFGEDSDGDGKHNGLWVYDEFTSSTGSVIAGEAQLNPDSFLATFSYPSRGVALVREATVVPVPAAAWLFLSACGALAVRSKVPGARRPSKPSPSHPETISQVSTRINQLNP